MKYYKYISSTKYKPLFYIYKVNGNEEKTTWLWVKNKWICSGSGGVDGMRVEELTEKEAFIELL